MGDLFTCFQFLIIDPSAWYQGSAAFNLGSWVFELHCLTKRCQFCCFWLGWTCKQVSRVRSSAVVVHFKGCGGIGGLTHGGSEGQEGFSFPGNRQVTGSAGWARGLQARLSVPLWLSVLLGAGTLWVSGQSEVEVPHLWAPLNTYVHIQYQGPRALPRDTSWHSSDWDHVVRGGHSCGSAESPDSAVLWLEGWWCAWTWRWLCQRGGSDEMSALSSRTCRCPLCIFLSPLLTRLSFAYNACF